MGCSITFPSGYILRGDPVNMYIELDAGIGYPDGLRNLSREGIKESLDDEKKFAKSII